MISIFLGAKKLVDARINTTEFQDEGDLKRVRH